MHQQQKHLVCQRNSLFCTNSLPSFTMCQYLSNTLPFLLVFNCIINSQSTLCRFINCFALLRVLSYLSDFSYSPEFIGKGVVFDGEKIFSFADPKHGVTPAPFEYFRNPSEASSNLPSISRTPEKNCAQAPNYLPPSPHPHNHYVFEGCRKTPCKNFSHLVP